MSLFRELKAKQGLVLVAGPKGVKMGSTNNEPTEVDYERIVKNEPHSKAVLFDFGNGKEKWIPKSQILEDIDEVKKVVVLPEWLCVREELV